LNIFVDIINHGNTNEAVFGKASNKSKAKGIHRRNKGNIRAKSETNKFINSINEN
jgi:hypothetical protein